MYYWAIEWPFFRLWTVFSAGDLLKTDNNCIILPGTAASMIYGNE